MRRQPRAETLAAKALLAAVCLACLTAAPVWAGLSAAAKCEALKNKEAGKYGFCLEKAQMKLVKTKGACSTTTDTPCYRDDECPTGETCTKDPTKYNQLVDKCDQKFSDHWGKWEDKAGGSCPTNGDEASLQSFVQAHVEDVASALSGGTALGRFVDNGDGTITDQETGLMWEEKNGDCPGGYSGSGSYEVLLSSGSFTVAVDGGGAAWTGTVNDPLSGFGSCSGTVAGTSLTGSCLSGAVTLSGTVDCEAQSVSVTVADLAGSGSGSATMTSTDVHDVYKKYFWSIGTNNPDGTAFTTFLTALNGGATGVGNCTTDSDGDTQNGGFAGHCDWRLPALEELSGIVDPLAPGCSASAPCIDPAAGPMQSDLYWTATGLGGDSSQAWLVNFGDGLLYYGSKTPSYYVRAVRGGL
jgi:Protein of unknown function (DUF1566)